MLPPGTVLMSARAPIGHLAVAQAACCTNQGCKNLIPGELVDTWHLFFALRISVPALKALGSGATFTEIPKADDEGFEIPLAPLHQQTRVAAMLTEQMAAVEGARAAAEAQLEAINALPAALLLRAFSGEL
jgi:type I restriction enzyme S subunit